MINKLVSEIKKKNAPIVVGLDPMLNYVPKHIQEKAFAQHGETLEGAGRGYMAVQQSYSRCRHMTLSLPDKATDCNV